MARAGRKPTIGRLVLMQAQFHRTVADLSRATGASPDTVRKVLRRAADRGQSLEMIQHKVARILNGDPDYPDSWIDIAGYAQLVADRLQGVSR